MVASGGQGGRQMRLLVLAYLPVWSLQGCAVQPVFQGITEITLNTQTSTGTHKIVLKDDRLKEAVECLEGKTTEIKPEAQSQDVLQEILLMGVKDKGGDRVFELTTSTNFSGNKGKFYSNDCIYRSLKK
jgi:hypothetical protein